MNKILVPKNPDETIILPPYVDFRHPDDIGGKADFLAGECVGTCILSNFDGPCQWCPNETKPSEQEGQE